MWFIFLCAAWTSTSRSTTWTCDNTGWNTWNRPTCRSARWWTAGWGGAAPACRVGAAAACRVGAAGACPPCGEVWAAAAASSGGGAQAGPDPCQWKPATSGSLPSNLKVPVPYGIPVFDYLVLVGCNSSFKLFTKFVALDLFGVLQQKLSINLLYSTWY